MRCERLLADVAAADLEGGDPEPVAVLVGEVDHEALVDHRAQQVVGRAAREVARAHDAVEGDRVGLAGQEAEHAQGARRGRDVAHGRHPATGGGTRRSTTVCRDRRSPMNSARAASVRRIP